LAPLLGQKFNWLRSHLIYIYNLVFR